MTKSPEERKAALARTIQAKVVAGGRIESQDDFSAVIVSGGKVNHILHLLLTVFTLGLWLIIWAGLGLLPFFGEKRELISVDEFGHVLVQKL